MAHDIFVVIEHLGGNVAEISYVMLAAARGAGGSPVAVLLGHNARALANDLAADRVLYIDDARLADFNADLCRAVLVALIEQHAPRAVLLGETSSGADLAGGLSACLDVPLVSYCRSLTGDGGAIKFVSQIANGKLVVEGDLPAPTALVTMIPSGYKADSGRATQAPPIEAVAAPALAASRVRLRQYLAPDSSDVDLSKESILIAVGRGVQNQDNLALADELAAVLGGTVCASRPVVDQGWLPTTRLVGKSGKRVKPKLYLALGISGATEHVEAITDSEVIVAVNTDPNAPIFNVAQYGAEVDMLDLLPALTERVRQAKAG
jgi:electron transfer flavoprotein alpha subunit